MLAVAAFIVFVIAALFKLVGSHTDILQWLIIIGGLLISAWGAWGWGRPWWTSRSGPPPPAV
jgi:hypothetical protein